MTASSRGSTLRPETIALGAIGGVVALVAGYLIAFVTAAGAVGEAVRAHGALESAGAPFAPGWSVAGWAFFDAQFVGTSVPGVADPVNVVGLAGVEFLYLVPPIVLAVAGGAVAHLAGVYSPRAGVEAGITVAVGYLVLAVVLGILVSFVRIGPVLVRLVVIAGIVYPVIFGALGGFLAGIIRAGRGPGAL